MDKNGDDAVGMDRTIEKKKWPPKKIAVAGSIALFALAIVYVFFFKIKGSTLNVQADRLTVAAAERKPFQEYIPVIGEVTPTTSVYLDAMEGGRVEEIFLQAGAMVAQGDRILRLANTNLLLDIMWREAELFQQSNNLRNTRLSMEQYQLTLKKELASVENQLQQQARLYERYKKLWEDKLISSHEYETARDQYEFLKKSKDLTIESQTKETEFRESQIASLEDSLNRMKGNLEITKSKQENLTLRAPISGHLTAMSAEVGQSLQPGQRIGQVDVLDGFKIRVPIDEHFISRISEGLKGKFDFGGKEHNLVIKKKYPEVKDGRFEVDMNFPDKEAEGITRGQSLQIRLELGDAGEALVIPRGGFFQTTGGNWIFVLDKSGKRAVRREIKLGRKNADVYEVLEGLEPGEKVITSSYEDFGDNKRLNLK